MFDLLACAAAKGLRETTCRQHTVNCALAFACPRDRLRKPGLRETFISPFAAASSQDSSNAWAVPLISGLEGQREVRLANVEPKVQGYYNGAP